MQNVNWGLAAAYIGAGAMEMALPIVVAVAFVRRMGARWRFFWIGVLTFLLSQGITRIPAMLALQSLPAFRKALEEPVNLWSFFVFAAFTAGLFEETGRWIAFRYAIAPEDRVWRNSVMFGVGHGGLESVGVGMVVLLALVNYLVITIAPPQLLGAQPAQLEAAKAQFAALQGWEPLLGAWERMMTLPIHMAFSVMVLFTFLRGFRWWWLALAAHTAVDFVAVAALHLATKAWGGTTALLATEGVVALMGAAAIWFLISTRRWTHEGESPPAEMNQIED